MREREALKLALDALEEPKEHIAKHRRLEAITAIRKALAQEQEPVCVAFMRTYLESGQNGLEIWKDEPLYTTPSQRKPLTDEQLKPLIQKAMMYYGHNPDHWLVTSGAGFCILARAIEAAHGIKESEKNT